MAGSAACLPTMHISGEKTISSASRIVNARHENVRNAQGSLNSDAVYSLLNRAMENFFETSSAQRIWGRLFKPADTVGIKINCLAGKGISTSHEVVDAIIENLLECGISKDRIIVWDRANVDLEKAGYHVKTSTRNVRYFGTDHVGYSRRLYESGQIGSFLSNILVKECTAIINVPILKDHGIVGITNALKNFFGAIHNPNKYHSHLGDPYIADVNVLSEIRNKTRLTVCDALTCQYEGGPPFMPQWTWHYNGIIVGRDMVALDTLGWKIIEDKRKENGLASLKEAGREPTYIHTAADPLHSLGIHDLSKIDLISV
ncbi:MAG: DUF362 domain-containing protein [candidate division KSB1 bacterium]|nr:DUF362 domain-containing protein [candidate division KSB1 bacterium]